MRILDGGGQDRTDDLFYAMERRKRRFGDGKGLIAGLA